MRRKLAKHVKGVREKKTSRDKKRTFHRVSPFITSTLAFILCTTQDLQEMKNIKEEEEVQLA